MKNLLNLGKALSKAQQKELNGGRLRPVVCNAPFLNAEPTCPPGSHPHPTHGVCICCAG